MRTIEEVQDYLKRKIGDYDKQIIELKEFNFDENFQLAYELELRKMELQDILINL